jgi:SAM-dependent methyltransferase
MLGERMSLRVGKHLADNYAEYYSVQDDLAEWRRLGAIDKAQNIVELCAAFPHEQVLEVGCGDGAVLQRLAVVGFGKRFTGIDISQSAIRVANDRQIPHALFEQFDGQDIPFETGSFDLAILTHVLEHVEYPRKLIYEASRVARNVFVEVPLEDNMRLPRDFAFDAVGHINFYKSNSIRRLVQSCGAKIICTKLTHSSLPLYVYRKGRVWGSMTYLLKELGLKSVPLLITHLLTYHFSLVYTSLADSAGNSNC